MAYHSILDNVHLDNVHQNLCLQFKILDARIFKLFYPKFLDVACYTDVYTPNFLVHTTMIFQRVTKNGAIIFSLGLQNIDPKLFCTVFF